MMTKTEVILEAITLMLIFECGIAAFAIYETYHLKVHCIRKFKVVSIFMIPFFCLCLDFFIKNNVFEYSTIMTLQTLLFFAFYKLYHNSIKKLNYKFEDFLSLINLISNYNNDIIWIIDKETNAILFANNNTYDFLDGFNNIKLQDINIYTLVQQIKNEELKNKIFHILDSDIQEIIIKPCEFQTTKNFFIFQKQIETLHMKKTFKVFVINVISEKFFDNCFKILECKKRKKLINLINDFLNCHSCINF